MKTDMKKTILSTLCFLLVSCFMFFADAGTRIVVLKKNVQKLISKASEKFYGLIGWIVIDAQGVVPFDEVNIIPAIQYSKREAAFHLFCHGAQAVKADAPILLQ